MFLVLRYLPQFCIVLRRMKPTAQAPYVNSVGFAVIVAFTLCQLLYLLGVYGITWAGVRLSICPVPLQPNIDVTAVARAIIAYTLLLKVEKTALLSCTRHVRAMWSYHRLMTVLSGGCSSQVAGVIFPVPIMLLVPIRQYIMPQMFPRAALAVLDPMPGGETGNLEADQPVVDNTSVRASI